MLNLTKNIRCISNNINLVNSFKKIPFKSQYLCLNPFNINISTTIKYHFLNDTQFSTRNYTTDNSSISNNEKNKDDNGVVDSNKKFNLKCTSIGDVNNIINHIYSLDLTKKLNVKKKEDLLQKVSDFIQNQSILATNNSEFSKLSSKLINLYLEINDLANACNIFNEYPPDPDNMASYNTFSELLISLVKNSSADSSIQFFKKWISNYSDYFNRGYFYGYLKLLEENKGDTEILPEIVKILESYRLLEKEPDIYNQLIIFCVRKGDIELSKKYYNKLVQSGKKPRFNINESIFQILVNRKDIENISLKLNEMKDERIGFAAYQHIFQLCTELNELEKLREYIDLMIQKIQRKQNINEIEGVGYLLFYNQLNKHELSTNTFPTKDRKKISQEIVNSLGKLPDKIIHMIIDTAIRCCLIYNRYETALEWLTIKSSKFNLPPNAFTYNFFVIYHGQARSKNDLLRKFWVDKINQTTINSDKEDLQYNIRAINIHEIIPQIEFFLTSNHVNNLNGDQNNKLLDSISQVNDNRKIREDKEIKQLCKQSGGVSQLIERLNNLYFKHNKIPPNTGLLASRDIIIKSINYKDYFEFQSLVPARFRAITLSPESYKHLNSTKEMINYLMNLEDQSMITRNIEIWNRLLYLLLVDKKLDLALKLAYNMSRKNIEIFHYFRLFQSVMINESLPTTKKILKIFKYITTTLQSKKAEGIEYLYHCIDLKYKIEHEPTQSTNNLMYFNKYVVNKNKCPEEVKINLHFKLQEAMLPIRGDLTDEQSDYIIQEWEKLGSKMKPSLSKKIFYICNLRVITNIQNVLDKHFLLEKFIYRNIDLLNSNMSDEILKFIFKNTPTDYHTIFAKQFVFNYKFPPEEVLNFIYNANLSIKDPYVQRYLNTYKHPIGIDANEESFLQKNFFNEIKNLKGSV